MLNTPSNRPGIPSSPLVLAPKVREGWAIREMPVVESTNLTAAKLPVWSALRAKKQTAGRGRFQRTWISDEGGLWLSAVVPMGKTPDWQALPLAVGLALCDTLRMLGVKQLRMRWPNDVLVQQRKLAGLLIDQFTPGIAVAGIGINVHNHPEKLDPALKDATVRLADLVPQVPAMPDLTDIILRNVRSVIEQFHMLGFLSLHKRINALWGPPKTVELELDNDKSSGVFSGVDHNGRLILQDLSGMACYTANQVKHLQEI